MPRIGFSVPTVIAFEYEISPGIIRIVTNCYPLLGGEKYYRETAEYLLCTFKHAY